MRMESGCALFNADEGSLIQTSVYEFLSTAYLQCCTSDAQLSFLIFCFASTHDSLRNSAILHMLVSGTVFRCSGRRQECQILSVAFRLQCELIVAMWQRRVKVWGLRGVRQRQQEWQTPHDGLRRARLQGTGACSVSQRCRHRPVRSVVSRAACAILAWCHACWRPMVSSIGSAIAALSFGADPMSHATLLGLDHCFGSLSDLSWLSAVEFVCSMHATSTCEHTSADAQPVRMLPCHAAVSVARGA